MADRELKVRISGDSSSFNDSIGSAENRLENFGRKIGDFERTAAKSITEFGRHLAFVGAGAAALVTGGAALFGLAKAAAEYGNEINSMKIRTGLAAEEVSKLAYAAKLSETSTEALGKGLAYLSNLMVGAASGAQDSSKLFKEFGISLRNQDGTIRGTGEVLGDLADIFSVMPDGPQKTALAIQFFGKKLGTELIPLLNEGRAGLKALGDEAERLGLVLNNEQAAAADQFMDNLERMSALAKGTGVSIGNHLIPAINKFMQKLQDARDKKFTLGEFFTDVLPEPGESPEERIKAATAELGRLKAQRAEIFAANPQNAGSVDTSTLSAQIAELEKVIDYLDTLNKRIEANDQESANKREKIAQGLQRSLISLAQLRGIAEGKVNADVLKDDATKTNEQIKNAEKLRDALKAAWQTSRQEAAAASADAEKMLQQASKVRTSAADKAAEMRNAGLSDEEKQALAYQSGSDALDQGRYSAAAAGAARLDGRLEVAKKHTQDAEQFFERAQKFAEKSGNADMVEEVGNRQAGLIEQQAKAKKSESADLEQRAADQQQKIAEIDGQIEQLKVKAAGIQISADITQLEGAVASAIKELEKLPATKEVTILVKQAREATSTQDSVAADINSAGLQGFATGGLLRGPGSGTSDSILARLSHGEYIVKAAAVNHYGAPLLNLINSMQLPKFAEGGAVGRSSAPGGTPVVLDFGKLGQFKTMAETSVAREVTEMFARAAMQRGRR